MTETRAPELDALIAEVTSVAPSGIAEVIDALDLAVEWDVEYAFDGEVVRHCDQADSFDEVLGRDEAAEIAAEYNATEGAPGAARVVYRLVTDFRPAE